MVDVPGVVDICAGIPSPVMKDSRPYPQMVASTCCCHMRKFDSVSLTEIGRLVGKAGRGKDDDELTLAFDS